MLKAITSPLMDLHGQFQHQELLKESCQLKTLDEFGSSEIRQKKLKFKSIYSQLKQIKKQLSNYNFDSKDREKLLDMYAYQINEIEEANFVQGEEENLKEFRMKVLNQEKIIDSVKRANAFFDSEGLVYQIKRLEREFENIAKYLPEKQDVYERISSVKYELEDLEGELQNIGESIYFDEYSAKQNEDRLDLLSSFKKKYGYDIPAIGFAINIDFSK